MMAESNFPEAHVIDITELLHSMEREQTCRFQDGKTELAVIHVVEQHARDGDKEMYVPRFLSIGPYHYGSPSVHDMQKIKYVYLNYILKLNPEKGLADYLAAIKGIETQVNCAYANDIKMDRDSFLKVLLLDGCFLIVALNRIEGIIFPIQDCNTLDVNTGQVNAVTGVTEVHQRNKVTQNDIENLCEDENSSREYDYYHETVLRDILLLENQIPFCVVKKIVEVLTGSADAASLFTDVIKESMVKKIHYIPREIRGVTHKEFHHLLHLCHLFFQPHKPIELHLQKSEKPRPFNKLQFLSRILNPSTTFFRRNKQAIEPDVVEPESLTKSGQLHHWRRATEYSAAKISFTKRAIHDNGNSLLDIGFCNGTLQIPCLSVDPTTFCLLSNLIAFEQACPQFGNHIASYIRFWSQLVSTPEDAAMLIENGIIISHLQSDMEVAEQFSALSDGITFDLNSESYLKPLCHMVEAHYRRQRPGWRQLFGTVHSNIQSWISQRQSRSDQLTVTQSVQDSL